MVSSIQMQLTMVVLVGEYSIHLVKHLADKLIQSTRLFTDGKSVFNALLEKIRE